ncbi:MAG: hypothetical protein E6G22_15315 [Actinobacteria bacterium]|nr:MAG: hypothetical protein E6G22_15315 [Actinomycetota bacterium]
MAGRALLLGLVALVGASPASTQTLSLAGPVSELAADGGRVAILVRTKTGNCARDRVAVWAPATRSFVPIGASACVGSTSTGAGLFSVGLAGTRVAYVQFAGGNTRELQLRLATLASPRAATVASASFGVDVGQGTYIGRVAGDGSLLAFDWWSECGPCAQATPVAPRASIFRLVSSGGAACPNAGLGALPRCRPVISLAGSLRLLAVGGGLVVTGAGDEVAVRALDGAPVYTGTFAGLRAARIDARVLLVLTRAGTQSSLWTVDLSLGLRSGPWILPSSKSAADDVCAEPSGCRPAALRLADYQAGIAVYVVGHGVHLLRLSDKRDVTIAAPGLGPVHVQLEQSGLFYSYRPAPSPTRGRVAFMPMAAVLARFR